MNKKKILMISPMFPYPAYGGDKLRILNSIKELSKYYDINLICLSEEDIDDSLRAYIKKYCSDVTIITKYVSKKSAMMKFIVSTKAYHELRQDCTVLKDYLYKEITSNDKIYEYIYFHFYHSMTAIDIEWINDNTKIIVDEHNADELIWQTILDNSNILKKVMIKANINRIKRFKNKRKDSIDYLLSVSSNDLQFNQTENKIKGKYLLVPNGVEELEIKINNLKDTRNIVFVGSMDVTMNVEAVVHFYENIYNIIKENVEGCKLYIVGKNPVSKIINLQERDESVIVTGKVKDIKEYYEIAKVCIAPFKIGGGTKLKILEAMMMKKVIVSTTCGSQGIDVENKKHLIIEDEDNDFARAVIEILNDNIDTTEIINNAFNLVNKQYTWESIFGKMTKNIENCGK